MDGTEFKSYSNLDNMTLGDASDIPAVKTNS